jgi:hypothetical protein
MIPGVLMSMWSLLTMGVGWGDNRARQLEEPDQDRRR